MPTGSAPRRSAKANANLGVLAARELGVGSGDLPDKIESGGAVLPRYDMPLEDEPTDTDRVLAAARERESDMAVLGRRAEAGAGGKHGDNLALLLSDEQRKTLGYEIKREIDIAKRSRLSWIDLMVKAVKRLGFDRETEKRSDPFPGASAVVHPAFAQACVDFQARAAGQLCPPDGPAKASVEGKSEPQREEAAERVARFLNWQCTRQMPEWAAEKERLLMMLPAEGSSFLKLWYDPVLQRPRVAYVSSEFIIAPFGASDEMTTPLLAEEIRLLDHERKANVASRYWLPHEPGQPPALQPSELEAARKKVTGLEPAGEASDLQGAHVYYEAQVRRVIPGLEGDQAFEWIVTICATTDEVVAIYRNWDSADPARERRRMLLHYKMFPWDGFYGIGLFHLIGGLTQAATGSLRALLDQAMAATLGGGLIMGHKKANGGTITVAPGTYANVDVAGVDDIRKAVMPDIFGEPSAVLFELLQFVVGAAGEFASVALKEVAETNANVPVGTTLARLDEGSRVYSGIYRRLHRVQALELETLYKIDAKTLPKQLAVRPYHDPELTPADFGPDISVAPVSDPNTYSTIQRQMKAQARKQAAIEAAQLGVKVNMRNAIVAACEAQDLPDLEELFPEDPEPFSGAPFEENLAALRGAPLATQPADDDDAHLTVHLPAAMLPGAIATPPGQAVVTHMQEHAAKGAMKIATAISLAKEKGADPAALGLVDPAQWYTSWMERIGQCMLPPPDPAVAAVAEVEKEKVKATKEKTQVDAAAKIEVAEKQSQLKLRELEAEHQNKMEELDRADDHEEARITADVQMKREAIASQERQKAADIMAKAATPPPPKPDMPPGRPGAAGKKPAKK